MSSAMSTNSRSSMRLTTFAGRDHDCAVAVLDVLEPAGRDGNAVEGAVPLNGGGRVAGLLTSELKVGKVDITVAGGITPMPRTGRAMGVNGAMPNP